MKLKIFILLLILCLPIQALGAKIVEYGFEDPTTTTTYPVTATSALKQGYHLDATQVITSYEANEMSQTWTPHSGSYFLIQNDGMCGSCSLSPSVTGVTAGTVNADNHFWRGDPYCSTDQGGSCSTIRLGDSMSTGEIFIRVWARFNNGFYNFSDPGRMKFLRILGQTGYNPTEDTVYMHLSTDDGISPTMYFACSGEPGTWIGTSYTATNAYDGNWHKFSMYVNYNTGVIKAWYDVDDETADNYVKIYTAADGSLGATPATESQYFIIQGNFSAKLPSQETYHALDDIEVWDGMPTGTSDTAAPTFGSASIAANGTSVTINFSEEVNDDTDAGDFDLDCTATGNDIALTYASGEGTTALVYTAGSTVAEGDTCNLDYDADVDADDMEDMAGNDLVTFSNQSVTNSSADDQTAPVISNGLPTGAQACTVDPRSVLMEVTTDETATCKYDTADDTYANLSNTFSSTGTTAHSQTLAALACDAAYTYYVRCTDGTNVNGSSTSITFTIDADVQPPASAKILSVGG